MYELKEDSIVEVTLKVKVKKTYGEGISVCFGCIFYEEDIPCSLFNMPSCEGFIFIKEDDGETSKLIL